MARSAGDKLLHAGENRLEIAPLRHVYKERVIGTGSADLQDLESASCLPGGPPKGVQEVGFADQSRAGTGQQQPAAGHSLNCQAVHVQVTFQREVQRLAVPSLLAGVEDHHVETLAGRQDVAQPRKQIRLHETDARLVQVRVLSSEVEGLFVEVHAHNFLSLTEGLGVDRKTTAVTAEVQHALARAESRQGFSVGPLVEEEAGLVLTARGDAETEPMLGDGPGGRRD